MPILAAPRVISNRHRDMAHKSNYDPFAVRRRVRLDHAEGEVLVFKTKSMTDKRDNSDRYHPTVDLRTGVVSCGCWNFRNVHAHHNPHICTPDHICKHLTRCINNLLTQDLIPDHLLEAPGCVACGGPGATLPTCDNNGRPTPGLLCEACCESRMDTLADADPTRPDPAELAAACRPLAQRLADTLPAITCPDCGSTCITVSGSPLCPSCGAFI